MIRNKYNGYGFDGSRLYHDPISLSIAATKAGAASSAAAAAAATKAAAGTAAAQTAALETAKQAAIQTGMKQAGVEAAKQAGIEATKQAGIEAAKQSAVEASKQGIAQGFQKVIPQAADDVAGLAKGVSPSTPLPPAGNVPQMTLEQQLAQIQAKPTNLSQFPQYQQVATGPGGQTPLEIGRAHV